jgi:hypothetical protein
MTDHPTLAQQIEALEWAAVQAVRAGNLRMATYLEAAMETLKHLEFMRETLR